MKNLLNYLAFSILMLMLFSCKKDTVEPLPTPVPEPGPVYTVPTTYSFTNADYSTSSLRLAMMGEIVNHIRATHTTTAATQPTITAQKLRNMFANISAPFADAALNTSQVQLKDKTLNNFGFVNNLENAFDDAEGASITAAASPTTSTASNGVKGKLVSPVRAVLVNANGYEYKEFAEKGLMAALLYGQAMNLLNTISSFDNAALVNGSTAQEKAWDEAFGYFGVPVAFPGTTTNLKYWGSYCNSVNSAIQSNNEIMNAFLKGRAAISNKDNSARDNAATTVIKTWEKVAAAKCISYLKSAKNNLTDAATLHHVLSEANGFMNAFRYNPVKTIADADIDLLLGYLGTNLYNLSPSNLDLAITKLETVFSLNSTIIP